MVLWCSVNCKCSSTMNRQDKPNHAISRTFRLRGWKLIWQHAFKRQPGATGWTWANICFYVSFASVVFNYYALRLYGQSFTLGCSLQLQRSTFNLLSTECFSCCILWIFSIDDSFETFYQHVMCKGWFILRYLNATKNKSQTERWHMVLKSNTTLNYH